MRYAGCENFAGRRNGYFYTFAIMGKGRNKELISLRDEALFKRYIYWTEGKRRRFDDVLRILSKEEFFISEERILAIIRRKIREGDG